MWCVFVWCECLTGCLCSRAGRTGRTGGAQDSPSAAALSHSTHRPPHPRPPSGYGGLSTEGAVRAGASREGGHIAGTRSWAGEYSRRLCEGPRRPRKTGNIECIVGSHTHGRGEREALGRERRSKDGRGRPSKDARIVAGQQAPSAGAPDACAASRRALRGWAANVNAGQGGAARLLRCASLTPPWHPSPVSTPLPLAHVRPQPHPRYCVLGCVRASKGASAGVREGETEGRTVGRTEGGRERERARAE